MAVQHRINTTKMLSNDGYFNGGTETFSTVSGKIAINPLVESQYKESVTEDPVLL